MKTADAHNKVLTAYENPTKSKEISVEDMQKIVDANEKLIKGVFNAGIATDKEDR